MRNIEQMYAEGDFDAIRQLLDEVEAKAKKEKAKKVLVAREELVAAMKNYTAACGVEMSDKEVENFRYGLMNLEKPPVRSASILTDFPILFDLDTNFPSESKPNVKTNTDADVLRKFLSREI